NQVAQNLRVQNVRNQNELIGVLGNDNLNGNGNLVAARAEGNAAGHNENQIRCYNCKGMGYFARNCTVWPRRRDAAYLQTQLLIAQKEEARIKFQAEEFDLMAVATDKAPVYDSNGSAENVRNQVAQNLRVQNVGNQNELIGVLGNDNLNGNGNLVAARAEGNAAGHNENQIRCYNCKGMGYFARNCTVWPRRRDAAYLQTQLLIAQKEEARIKFQAEEFDLMAVAVDLDEIKEVNAN
nr:hypothetical protein [Tanacetum cinerariifolium]